jgi:phospholipid/cholesterol/gamma-HCH transport system ATP-binding protein
MNSSLQNRKIEVPALEFRHVTFGFEEPVIKDVSFKLNHGATIVITGRHESGKSVLLRLANGLFQPDEGEILIEGQHIEKLDEQDLLKIRGNSICLVFQESALFTSLTVYDNVAFRLREQEWDEELIDKSVRELLRFVNLEDSVDKYYEELSVGMKRRLEIARSLVGWPPIMLFDEPTSGIDPVNTKYILNLILGARDIHKVSSLYVTKELWEINYIDTHYVEQHEEKIAVAERDEQHICETDVLVLENGSVAFYGKPGEFDISSLPAVLDLTHPKGTMYRADEFSPLHLSASK